MWPPATIPIGVILLCKQIAFYLKRHLQRPKVERFDPSTFLKELNTNTCAALRRVLRIINLRNISKRVRQKHGLGQDQASPSINILKRTKFATGWAPSSNASPAVAHNWTSFSITVPTVKRNRYKHTSGPYGDPMVRSPSTNLLM